MIKVIYKNMVDDFNTVVSNFNYNNTTLNVNLGKPFSANLGKLLMRLKCITLSTLLRFAFFLKIIELISFLKYILYSFLEFFFDLFS